MRSLQNTFLSKGQSASAFWTFEREFSVTVKKIAFGVRATCYEILTVSKVFNNLEHVISCLGFLLYKSRYNSSAGFCWSEGCVLGINRLNFNEQYYYLTVATYLPDADYVYNKQGNWYYGCVTNDTDIGRYICSILEQDGWGVADQEY